MAEDFEFEPLRPLEADEEGVGSFDIRSNLIFSHGKTNLDFKVGRVPLADKVGFSSIVLIAEVDRQILVGVPKLAWHKKTANRLLPPGALTKPVLSSVASCSDEGQDVPSERFLKMWIGLLNPELESSVEFDAGEETDLLFVGDDDLPAFPFGIALVELASEKFTFLTAESGVGGEGKIEERIKDLEKNFSKIQESLELLLQQRQGPGVVPRLGARAKAVAEPKPAKSVKGLDPAVVRSALAAGIPEDHLLEVAGVVGKQPNKMEDIPRTGPKRNVVEGLSESEDGIDELEEELAAGDAGDGGVAKAIVQLTKVLASQKKPRPRDPIERILDMPSSSGSHDGFGSGSSRRNAAALQALRKCLVEKPEYIYSTIEDRLQQDFAARPSHPGQPLGGATVRGWLEARSRIQNYVGHVRWTWSVGQIWQCLVDGKTQEARARASLLVAAADQAAIDNGSWLLSQVLLLEGPAPFGAFQNHQPPAAHELPHSSLIDPRWMELLVSHVKEVDSFQEAKRRLGKGGGGSSSKETGGDKPDKPVPKVKAKYKAKAKASAQKEAGEEAE